MAIASLFLVPALLGGLPAKAPQPVYRSYRSVEVLALSGASMVGVPIRIEAPTVGGEQVKVSVVFRNCVGFNSYIEHPEVGAFLSVDKGTVAHWIEEKARILTFEDGEWMNLDNTHGAKFFDAKLNRIKDVDSFIRALQKARRDRPEIERIRSFYRPITDDEAKRIGVPAGSSVGLPLDRNLERWAIANIDSSRWWTRNSVAHALGYFESPENIKRLIKLLKDPYAMEVGRGRLAYPVRQSASRALANWGVKHDRVE